MKCSRLFWTLLYIMLTITVTSCDDGLAPPPEYFKTISIEDTGDSASDVNRSTVIFRLMKGWLYILIDNVEMPQDFHQVSIGGMWMPETAKNELDVSIRLSGLEEEWHPSKCCFKTVCGKFDISRGIKKKRFNGIFWITYHPYSKGQYDFKRLVFSTDLNIREGETIVWEIEKLSINNAMNQIVE